MLVFTIYSQKVMTTVNMTYTTCKEIFFCFFMFFQLNLQSMFFLFLGQAAGKGPVGGLN